jgi:hypothetical protein
MPFLSPISSIYVNITVMNIVFFASELSILFMKTTFEGYLSDGELGRMEGY